MEWQEYFQDAREMAKAISTRLEREKELIRYVNLRYRLQGQAETKWLYDITLTLTEDQLLLTTGDDKHYALPLDEIDYIKLRPFYYAACVGFKELTFYGHPEEK